MTFVLRSRKRNTKGKHVTPPTTVCISHSDRKIVVLSFTLFPAGAWWVSLDTVVGVRVFLWFFFALSSRDSSSTILVQCRRWLKNSVILRGLHQQVFDFALRDSTFLVVAGLLGILASDRRAESRRSRRAISSEPSCRVVSSESDPDVVNSERIVLQFHLIWNSQQRPKALKFR